MKQVLIITHIQFWKRNSGDASRVNAMIDFLRTRTILTVVYGGGHGDIDLQLVTEAGKGFELILLGRKGVLSIPEYMVFFERWVSDRHFDVCIVEHVFLSFLTEILPSSVKLILDTNDIVSDRVASFQKANMGPRPLYDVSQDQELSYFQQYDHIMAIQKPDFEKIAGMGMGDKMILAPHPILPQKHQLRPEVRVIGFVGSSYVANVDALEWFTGTVWPSLRGAGIGLHIYGNVATGLTIDNMESISLKGFVDDLHSIYEEIDIVINPVRLGAGLKIKNLEALGHGLPLVTTSHGATGIGDEATRSFLVADDPAGFLSHLTQLIGDYELRQKLGHSAYRFIEEEFSPEKCFGPLLQEINQPKKVEL